MKLKTEINDNYSVESLCISCFDFYKSEYNLDMILSPFKNIRHLSLKSCSFNES